MSLVWYKICTYCNENLYGGHSGRQLFSLRVFVLFFLPLLLNYEQKDRGLVLLCEAAATRHQGHLQWVITLEPGPRLQRLKSTPRSLLLPRRRLRGLGLGVLHAAVQDKSWKLLYREGISEGWMGGGEVLKAYTRGYRDDQMYRDVTGGELTAGGQPGQRFPTGSLNSGPT